jgi:hypothetical protein
MCLFRLSATIRRSSPKCRSGSRRIRVCGRCLLSSSRNWAPLWRVRPQRVLFLQLQEPTASATRLKSQPTSARLQGEPNERSPACQADLPAIARQKVLAATSAELSKRNVAAAKPCNEFATNWVILLFRSLHITQFTTSASSPSSVRTQTQSCPAHDSDSPGLAPAATPTPEAAAPAAEPACEDMEICRPGLSAKVRVAK